MAVLLVLLGAVLVSSQVMGQCAVKPAVQNFDVEKFMGTWYFIKESSSIWHSDSSKYKCNQLNFALKADGDINSDFTIYNKSSNTYETFTRTIRKESPDSTEGRFRIFRDGFTGEGTMYTITSIDYDKYATVWMCRRNRDTGAAHEMPYLMARSRTLSSDLVEEAKAHLPSDHTYRSSDQTNCPARN